MFPLLQACLPTPPRRQLASNAATKVDLGSLYVVSYIRYKVSRETETAGCCIITLSDVIYIYNGKAIQLQASIGP